MNLTKSLDLLFSLLKIQRIKPLNNITRKQSKKSRKVHCTLFYKVTTWSQ